MPATAKKMPMNNTLRAALARLIQIAQGESGQCRVVANFLLAWWNADAYGGFDLTDILAVDKAIAMDMARCIHASYSLSPLSRQSGVRQTVRNHRAPLAIRSRPLFPPFNGFPPKSYDSEQFPKPDMLEYARRRDRAS
jgi:hypothetical protein